MCLCCFISRHNNNNNNGIYAFSIVYEYIINNIWKKWLILVY